MVFPLLALLFLNPFLLGEGQAYRWCMAVQVALYGSSLAYLLLRNTQFWPRKLLSIPYFFCLVNAAALAATWNVVRGHRIDRWEPSRAAHGGSRRVIERGEDT